MKGKALASIRVLIAGGGTGGHIIPALAVARELVDRYDADVLFVGTPRGLELKLVPDAGFKLRLVNIGPLNSVPWMTRLKTVLQLPRAISDCKRLMREFQPGAVLGVGGYVSGPALAAALKLKLPTMVFEPNAMPGMANRMVGHKVKAAAVNFPVAVPWFSNCQVTGIPVRPEFFSLPDPDPDKPHLLVFGGSQGARILNNQVPPVIARLLDAVPGLTVLHQSGTRHAQVTEASYLASGADPSRWEVRPYIDDMPACFGRASLVMSRAGASTVAELAAAGRPALLVPFAAAADGHQKRNAEAMVGAGAAVMLNEWDLDVQGRLLETLTNLLNDRARLHAMSLAARTQAHPDAADRIARKLVELAQDGKDS
jgi:UDP-N-acetylglucosamine--N-acetylmuramyl-(pentapeptide) pyrophosphoryl-undecaprenol N-acetylglucosamine transferase